jgi:rSAM/selenodomain-associated transferase 1
VVVYGRRPEAGAVKTRLAATVGGAAAAGIYRELLLHSLSVAGEVDSEPVLSLADQVPDDWTPGGSVRIEVQVPGDLGERLAETFRLRFEEGCSEVLIIGSDCAELESRHLVEAFASLEFDAVVLGPARDGGYWLVGQRAPGYDLFSGIPWSTAETLTATRRRLRRLDLGWRESSTLADVDTATDLERFLESNRGNVELAGRLRRARDGHDDGSLEGA